MVNGTLRRAESVASLVRAGHWGPLRALVTRGLLPAPLFRWVRFVICRLDGAPVGKSTGLSVRFAGREDLDQLCSVRHRRRAFRRYLDDGARPVLGTLDGRPATICWLEPGRIHVSRSNGYSFEMGPDAVWAFGCEVAESMRRRGLYREHWARLMELLHDRGIRSAYLSVMLDDERSLAAHQRIGFTPLWELSILRLLGLVHHSARGLAPASGLAVARFGRWHGRADDTGSR